MSNVLFLLIAVAIFITIKDKSCSSSGFGEVTSSESIVYIVYAPWCGHCKKSMGEFKKASENPNIILINSDDASSKEIMKQLDVSGFPTIIRNDGTKYNGERKADSIIEFANGN